jgi:iron(III) transport system substrate-binding protein
LTKNPVRLTLLAALLALMTAASALAAGSTRTATTLTIYSGREEKLVKPLLELFTKETGIETKVRYGDSAELAATLVEEEDNSPADVFFAQDAGALGAVAREGLLRILPDSTLAKVGPRFRAPGKRWVGTSGRARVVAYNTETLTAADLPSTIWGFTGAKWKGKIGLPPTNASFQAFVTAMRLTVGEDRTRDWLTAIKANGARFYAKNGQVLQAIARKEVEVGFVNHYYLYELKAQQPTAPVANHFLGHGDPGALVNAAGVGIVSSTDKVAAAQRFVDYLLSQRGQRYIARGPGMAEYPLVRGVQPRPGLPKLGAIQGPEINLGRLGQELPKTLELLNEVGYTQ